MKNSFLICITCFNNSSIEQCALIILVTVQMQQVTPDFTLTHVLLAEIKVVGTPAHNPNKQTNKHCVLLWLWNNLYISDLSHETVQSRGEKHHCHGLPAAQGTAQLLQEGGGPVHQQVPQHQGSKPEGCEQDVDKTADSLYCAQSEQFIFSWWLKLW